MRCLLDTSILVCYVNAGDAQHPSAVQAVDKLLRRGDELFITGQNLIEFWNVATRPIAVNGLELSAPNCAAHVASFRAAFILAEDRSDILPEWQRLAEQIGVIGKQVHDLRLVAVCLIHGIDHLMTFNTGHFARLTAPAGLTLVEPASV